MEDPLHVLRNALRAKFAINLLQDDEPTTVFSNATHLELSPTTKLPTSTPTRLRKPNTTSMDPEVNPDDFLSIGAVYLAWISKDVSTTEYLKQVRESGLTGVTSVAVADRKNIIEWLEGKQKELPNVAPLTITSTTPPGSPGRSASHLAPSASLTSPLKRKYVTDPLDLEAVKKIRSHEIELRDRNSVLRGAKPTNFTALQKLYADRLKKLKDSSRGDSSNAQAAAKPALDPKAQAKKAKHNYPIIMISSSPTSLITMHNVKRFLEDAVFEPSNDARTRALTEGNGKPEDMIPIYRKKTSIGPGGKEIVTQGRYFVVDGIDALSKFGADAWDRVVCVMTTGQAWQFRPYKWSDPRQLFHHVKGVYVTWSNDPPNPKIQDWNVMELKIDPHRRHVDKSIVAHYWKTLDTWTATNKPWLMA